MQIEAKDRESGSPVDVKSSGGAVIFNADDGQFADAVRQGDCYYGANQTGCVWTVGLATTNTGLCVSNPIGSSKILSILMAGYSEIVAPTGINDAWLAGGYHASTNVVAGVAEAARNLKIGGPAGVGQVWTGATLPVAPTYILPIQTGHTAAALSGGSPCLQTINGIIQVPAGGFVIVACFTIGVAVGAKAAILWREVSA